eukprot:6131738-Amphidinium_carterae.1
MHSSSFSSAGDRLNAGDCGVLSSHLVPVQLGPKSRLEAVLPILARRPRAPTYTRYGQSEADGGRESMAVMKPSRTIESQTFKNPKTPQQRNTTANTKTKQESTEINAQKV